jgi:hypothetical protein
LIFQEKTAYLLPAEFLVEKWIAYRPGLYIPRGLGLRAKLTKNDQYLSTSVTFYRTWSSQKYPVKENLIKKGFVSHTKIVVYSG